MTEKPITNNSKVSTEPYKGVRDFYPEDMAIQNYIFDTWKRVAKKFEYVEYAASILEPAELYKSKGQRNEEMVNEQMYTFIDKGDREVALRPEMTPTLARMVAARRKGLKLPLRWFSIPNCFRYERSQRGRRREHWQLNCDIMGNNKDFSTTDAEVEIISLAYNILKEFGAKDEDFLIRIGSRIFLDNLLINELGMDIENAKKIKQTLDRIEKMTPEEIEIAESELSISFEEILKMENEPPREIKEVLDALKKVGISNAKFAPTIVRGFDYYTGIVFEVFDTNEENKRALFGGGRYDNLLEMFGVEALPTVGFGMGDVTMRDFLETHNLLPKDLK
ncbi:MAG: ATP phosphoribosyltransferase regulatory subunit [Patescibacteria group bacterium]